MKLKNKFIGPKLYIAVVRKEKVIRRCKGAIIVCAWPKTDPNRVPTLKEQIVRAKFTNGVAYSMLVNSVEEVKEYYKSLAKPWQTGYNVAVRDGFNTHVPIAV